MKYAPLQRFDALRGISLLCQDGPHGNRRSSFVPDRRCQTDADITKAQVGLARSAAALARHLQDLRALLGSGLHRLPQASLLVLELTVVFCTHQQLGAFRVRYGFFKPLPVFSKICGT